MTLITNIMDSMSNKDFVNKILNYALQERLRLAQTLAKQEAAELVKITSQKAVEVW